MAVKDIMTRIVVTASPDTTVEDAARMMKKHAIGFLPVADVRDLEVQGVLTDRDITLRLVAEGLNARETAVRRVMSAPAVFCFEDQDLEDACLRMGDAGLRRILVYDRARNLTGILSLDDIAVKAAREKLGSHVLKKSSHTA